MSGCRAGVSRGPPAQGLLLLVRGSVASSYAKVGACGSVGRRPHIIASVKVRGDGGWENVVPTVGSIMLTSCNNKHIRRRNLVLYGVGRTELDVVVVVAASREESNARLQLLAREQKPDRPVAGVQVEVMTSKLSIPCSYGHFKQLSDGSVGNTYVAFLSRQKENFK